MNAWNGVSAPACRWPRPPRARRQASPKRRTCTKPVRSVRNRPAPRRMPTIHGMNSQSAADWMRSRDGPEAWTRVISRRWTRIASRDADYADHAIEPTGRGCRALRGWNNGRGCRGSRGSAFERPWQPSTGTHAPLIQLARGEARKATTAPTSSGRPKRPNGSSRRTKSAMPSGSACWRLCHEPPGKQDRPGRDAVDADVERRELLRQRLRRG